MSRADSLALHRANLLLQRRSRIERRKQRIELLQSLLIHTPDDERAETLRIEIGRMRLEIEMEGPDPP